jgi:hypothetical protein
MRESKDTMRKSSVQMAAGLFQNLLSKHVYNFEFEENIDVWTVPRQIQPWDCPNVYRVAWKGYGIEHNSWEPESNVVNAPKVVADYWNRQAEKQAGLEGLLRAQ